MTDRQFKTITKKLHFYNQGGIKNLCTMTETTLRQVMEEAAGVTQAYIRKLVQHDVDQQNKIALLSAKVYKLQKENAKVEELEKENAELKNERNAFKIYSDGAELDAIKLNEQLTKAKELIRDLLSCLYSVEYDCISDLEEAEQFISEVEK